MKKMENLKEALQSIHDIQFRDESIQISMLFGYRLALLMNGLENQFGKLVDSGDTTAQIEKVVNTFLEYERAKRNEAIADAQYLFNSLEAKGGKNYEDALNSVFGILTNAQKFTKEGHGCDSSGNQAEDDTFNAIGTIEEYQTVQYYNEATGITSDDPANGGERIRVMFTNTAEGADITITQKNETMLAAGVIKVVENNNELIYKLLASVGVDPSTGKDIGTASIVRSTIVDIAKNMGIVEYAEGTSLIKAISAGNVQNFRHIMIGTMETLTKLEDNTLLLASANHVKRYIDWINIFSIIPQNQQEQIIKDDDLRTYVDGAGNHLCGVDDAGRIVTGNTVSIAQNRKYLVYLGKKVADHLHAALVTRNTEIHPLKPELITAYAETACK